MGTVGKDFSCVREQEVWESHCAGKDRYPSAQAAEAHARLLYRTPLFEASRFFPRQEWNLLHAYRCMFVLEGEDAHYHLGHLRS